MPRKLLVKGRFGGKDFVAEHGIDIETGIAASMVPRLWAGEYVHRLLGGDADARRAKVLDLGLEYGLITPYTSSLALESEAAYAQQGIRRRNSPLRGVHLTSLTSSGDEGRIAAGFSPHLAAGCSKSTEADLATREPPAATRARGEEENAARYSVAGPHPDIFAAAAPAAAEAADPSTDPPNQAIARQLQQLQLRSAPAHMAAKAAGSAWSAPSAGGVGLGAKTAQPRKLVDLQQAIKDAKAPKDAAIVSRRPLGRCSDAAARPLAERIVLWKKRLDQVTGAEAWIAQYDAAHDACELPSFREQAALLELIEQRIDTEKGAEILLRHFAGDDDAQHFLARALLRRTIDVRIAAAVSRVLFANRVDWSKLDRELYDIRDPAKRLLHLRTAMLAVPGDPAGEMRLVRLLAQSGSAAEALTYGRRLRERGFLTPALAQQLGDVLAGENLVDEAMRTYSELVEFNQASPTSRRLLGDIYLRHGWYAEAYRQYKALAGLDSNDPTSLLRLGCAAAGAGRVDEALRIEREVAAGAGRPGPDDPRYWARLWSAARLGSLLEANAGAADPSVRENVARRIKDLQLFAGPGTLALVTWEDLDARLTLASADPAKETLTGEATDAGSTGLTSLLLSPDVWSQARWAVRFKADPPDRAVKFTVVALTWDDKSFSVKTQRGELSRGAKQAPL